MKLQFFCLVLVSIFLTITAPPVTQKKPDSENEIDSEIKENLADYMEYHRYLNEIVAALESDPDFRQKLSKADNVDIRTGKIAHELDFVKHNVRTKLDEIKRNELDRLHKLFAKQRELSNDLNHAKISSQVEHLDYTNPHTFEIEDLKKLIHKTTKDLEEADRNRKKEFKEYEMQKEFEKNQKLKVLDEENRVAYEKELYDREEKHKKHEPLHHPGSRQQLEEVWAKQDHMEDKFDPKVFFMLHDVDGNGVWDQNEVKALFIKELDKMYKNGAPEDDRREREEEMELMREHVFKESDTNHDGFISYEEFLVQTRKTDFEKDQGWKTIDEQEVYSPQEYQEFEKHRLQEIERLIAQGILPPQPVFDPEMQQYLHNVNQGPHQGYQQQYHPNAIPQGQPQYHPNAIPQGQPQYHPNQQFHPDINQQYYPNVAPPNQQFHPNAIPQNYQNTGQQNHPNIQMQPNMMAQKQQIHSNVPPQTQQVHPNVPPQPQQIHSNVPPQPQVHSNVQPQPQQVHSNVPPQPQQVHSNVPPQTHQGNSNIPPKTQQGQSNSVPPASGPHSQQYQNQQQIGLNNVQQINEIKQSNLPPDSSQVKSNNNLQNNGEPRINSNPENKINT